jgi:hypothetical protein
MAKGKAGATKSGGKQLGAMKKVAPPKGPAGKGTAMTKGGPKQANPAATGKSPSPFAKAVPPKKQAGTSQRTKAGKGTKAMPKKAPK